MSMNNTTTKKQYAGIEGDPVHKALPTKDVKYGNHPGKYEGQMRKSPAEKFAEPNNMGAPARIKGLEGLHDDIGERSGFITDGYLDKGDTPYGEDAKLNFLPPGMDINNQVMLEVHAMPLRTVVAPSYPGDGWQPAPRGVEE